MHYGPGGNSQVEAEVLGGAIPCVQFRDLPSGQTSYRELLADAATLLDSFREPMPLIAHSFGCDLAWDLAKQFPNQVAEILLISPITSLEKSFLYLAEKVLESSEASGELSSCINHYKEDESLEKLWKLLGCLFQREDLQSFYWYDKQKMNQILPVFATKQALHVETWQGVLADYLANDEKPFQGSLSQKIAVFLGEQDPYYKLSQELGFWQQKISDSDIHIIPQCSHWPHLESDFLKNFLN